MRLAAAKVFPLCFLRRCCTLQINNVVAFEQCLRKPITACTYIVEYVPCCQIWISSLLRLAVQYFDMISFCFNHSLRYNLGCSGFQLYLSEVGEMREHMQCWGFDPSMCATAAAIFGDYLVSAGSSSWAQQRCSSQTRQFVRVVIRYCAR